MSAIADLVYVIEAFAYVALGLIIAGLTWENRSYWPATRLMALVLGWHGVAWLVLWFAGNPASFEGQVLLHSIQLAGMVAVLVIVIRINWLYRRGK